MDMGEWYVSSQMRRGVRHAGPIVLVHDDPLYVATARDLLNDAGYEVASFTNLFEALDALEAGKTAELLIVRADMPTGMPSGVSLALTARQRRKGI